MSLLKILRIGDPFLRNVAEEVKPHEIENESMQKLIKDMYETMICASGCGLAAPQIGVSKRIIIVGLEKEDLENNDKDFFNGIEIIENKIQINNKELEESSASKKTSNSSKKKSKTKKNNIPQFQTHVLINPVIKELDSPKQSLWEGCLSVPNFRGVVERSSKIQLTWLDEKAKKHVRIVSGIPALIYQHEKDHLEGILYVDRLKSFRDFAFNEELEYM